MIMGLNLTNISYTIWFLKRNFRDYVCTGLTDISCASRCVSCFSLIFWKDGHHDQRHHPPEESAKFFGGFFL